MSSRHYLIGMDEAGYGPNLGPLVIAATVWSYPADFSPTGLWPALSEIVTQSPTRNDTRLHVADSKEVYSSGKGIDRLEKSVLSFLLASGQLPQTLPASFSLHDFLISVHRTIPDTFQRQLWYESFPLKVPRSVGLEELDAKQKRVKEVLEKHEIQLESCSACVVCPEKFNLLTEQLGNKSNLLTTTSFELLRNVWPKSAGRLEIFADKHGGRNKYLPHLLEAFPDHFFVAIEEGRQRSIYRTPSIELSLAVGSERHLPVALASMLAKYVRELCMIPFNAYWADLIPNLKPTKGYPQDAARFMKDIESVYQLMASTLPRNVLWRNR